MTTDRSSLLPESCAQAIERAAAAIDEAGAQLPVAQQIRQQVPVLRAIAINQGLDGVKAHKLTNSAAKQVRVVMQPIVYVPKPKGYNAYLANLVERWLTNKVALYATNVADVTALNDRLGTTLNTANHFSEPLSQARLTIVKKVFETHGAPLDVKQSSTMSKVREAAKSWDGKKGSDRSFAGIGVIAGKTLVIGQEIFPIETNGKTDGIRISINGRRVRVTLDMLEWMADKLGPNVPDTLSTTTCSIGELAYPARQGQIEVETAPEISGLAYSEAGGLAGRITALRQRGSVDPIVPSDDRDPLEL